MAIEGLPNVCASPVSRTILYSYRVLAVLGFLLMVALVASSPGTLKYDEVFHVGLTKAIMQVGFVEGLTSETNESAAGPLFAAIHIVLEPLTKLNANAIRWVNVVCLFGIVAITWNTLRSSHPYPLETSISILGINFIWPATGLALTEMPALLAFTVFVALMIKWLDSQSSDSRQFLLPICAGFALGIAILGRQTNLVTIPAVAAMFIWFPKCRISLAILSVTSFITCGWLFFLWQGLLPQSVQHADGGFKISHGLLSLSYMGFASFILNPKNLMRGLKKYALLAAFLSLACSVLLFAEVTPPAQGIVTRLIPEAQQSYAGHLIRSAMLFVGIIWLLVTLTDLIRDRNRPTETFMNLLVLALALAPAKISHLFSSRYVLGAVSVEAIRTSKTFEPFLIHFFILALSIITGAGTLLSYYAA